MGCIQSTSPTPTFNNNIHNNLHSSATTAAIYHALPSEYERHRVVNVYDGDTITIEDGRKRVRFLGIDCPELDERQPFAKEARDFVVSKCHNKHVYVSFEPGSEKTDRYGRLLAWIWVDLHQQQQQQQHGGFLNVNEALVLQGLANVYTPGNKKLQNHSKLIALQKKAREKRLGKWGSFQDVSVYKTRNGKAFHKRGCKHLAKSKSHNIEKISASKGTDRGLYPCRTCLPDM